ncbi:MAG: hypothetical protein K4H23_03965 [Mollicutes bacterium PWAP]|nr:hypothetical protein [Mollicutes bacterium PWAP]
MNYENLIKIIKSNDKSKKAILDLNITEVEIITYISEIFDLTMDYSKNEYQPYLFRDKNGNLKRSQKLTKIGILNEVSSRNMLKNYFEYELPITEKIKLSQKTINSIAEAAKNKISLYIYGNNNIEISDLLILLSNSLTKKNTVSYVKTKDLYNYILQSFNTKINVKNNLINLMIKSDFLFLDEIGYETNKSWFRDDVLFYIISKRIEKQLPTIINSEYPLVVLEKHFSDGKEIRQSKRIINLLNKKYKSLKS